MSREFYIAGVQHHKHTEVLDELKINSPIELIPEPSNDYDSNAVQLKFLGSKNLCMLGYVPAKFSAEISADIQIHGDDLKCIITELNPAAKPWERIKVKIAHIGELKGDDPNV